MSGRASLYVAIAAAILFACAAFLWLHFRGASEQPVVSFTPIAHATEPSKELPAEHSGTAVAGQPTQLPPKKSRRHRNRLSFRSRAKTFNLPLASQK